MQLNTWGQATTSPAEPAPPPPRRPTDVPARHDLGADRQQHGLQWPPTPGTRDTDEDEEGRCGKPGNLPTTPIQAGLCGKAGGWTK